MRAFVASVIVLLAAACSSEPAKNGPAGATASRALETQHLDLDGDGVPDSVVVVRADSAGTDSSRAGQTRRIELRLSHAGAKVLQDSAGWGPMPDEFNPNGNLVKSHLLYIADFERAGRLLFLFGATSGCCQQSLTIYRLGANGPEKYFYAREFFVDRSPVPQSGKVASIAGRQLSQAVAPPSSEYAAAVSYAPVTVYRLEEKPRLDSAATKALTKQELGGFAGFEPRNDVAALTRRDGSKVVWSMRERRAMQ